MRILDRPRPLAPLVIRLALGAIMIAAGSHKVFGGRIARPMTWRWRSGKCICNTLFGTPDRHGFYLPLAAAALAFGLISYSVRVQFHWIMSCAEVEAASADDAAF